MARAGAVRVGRAGAVARAGVVGVRGTGAVARARAVRVRVFQLLNAFDRGTRTTKRQPRKTAREIIVVVRVVRGAGATAVIERERRTDAIGSGLKVGAGILRNHAAGTVDDTARGDGVGFVSVAAVVVFDYIVAASRATIGRHLHAGAVACAQSAGR